MKPDFLDLLREFAEADADEAALERLLRIKGHGDK